MPAIPGSAALLFLAGSVFILFGICISARFLSTQRLQRDCVHAACYDSYDTLDDLILYRFLDRRLILSASAICACALDDKRRCFWSMLVHSSSTTHTLYDETAPLLVSRSKPDGPIYGSPPTRPDDFRPVRLISEGVSGKVYLVEDKVTKKNFALKVIRKRSDNLLQVINEKDVLCKVAGDPWFLSLEASMHDDTNFYLVTTLYQTDLRSDLHLRGGHIPVELARFYMAELICALEDLHARGIIHRDIKPANVLLTNDGHVVLADFGMAKFFPRHFQPFPDRRRRRAGRAASDTGLAGIAVHRGVHAPDDDDVTREKVGTMAYAAPEMRLGLPYSYEVDFWSLGVLFYVMLTGRFPFGAFGEYYFHRFEPVEVDEGAQALLEQILDIRPSKRPNIYEIKAHRFFSSVNWDSTAARDQPAPITPRIPAHPPLPKTFRISFGTPYNAVASDDPIPHFAFTSSYFQQLRFEPSPVTLNAGKRSQVAGLFGWMVKFVIKVTMWCTSLLSSCGRY